MKKLGKDRGLSLYEHIKTEPSRETNEAYRVNDDVAKTLSQQADLHDNYSSSSTIMLSASTLIVNDSDSFVDSENDQVG